MIARGNIVKSNRNGKEALVLALTKDGKRAKLHVFGADGDIWRPLNGVTLATDGNEVCWKCQGSGIYYISGYTENGVFKGQTGVCFGCGGNGKQDNDDRLRNHFYWNRGKIEERPGRWNDEGEYEPIPADPRDEPATATAYSNREAYVTMPSQLPPRNDNPADLINCKNCGTLHRSDFNCPWTL